VVEKICYFFSFFPFGFKYKNVVEKICYFFSFFKMKTFLALNPNFSLLSRRTAPDPRRTVLEGRNILERTGDSISRSHAVAIETEQIGTEVVGELGTQRETLLRTKGRLVDTDVEISRSRKILRSMYLNMIYNKLILIGIIVIEVCILGITIYLKFK
jgi:vesicle transport through interaction with t-SNAREs protein 1